MEAFTKQRNRDLWLRLHKLERGVLLMNDKLRDPGYNENVVRSIIQRKESEIKAILDELTLTRD